jgi:hypothetical protein
MQTEDARKEISASSRTALVAVAAKVFWWGKPEQWLENLPRFIAQVMTYGDWDDFQLTRKVFGEDSFRQVLEHPPAGVFDPKSWAYWHAYFHKAVPPLPARTFSS